MIKIQNRQQGSEFLEISGISWKSILSEMTFNDLEWTWDSPFSLRIFQTFKITIFVFRNRLKIVKNLNKNREIPQKYPSF